MRDWFSQPPVEAIRPDYNVYHFTDGIYKIVNFKSTLPRLAPPVRQETAKYDDKLVQSLSRSRRIVLELGLCNDWAYFCTFTLDPKKYDRHDLGKFKEDLSQFARDQRKKYKKKGFDFSFDYLFVPELHKDGSWHMHGLVSDISPALISFLDQRQQGKKVPDKLIKGDFFNWPDYEKKFGFCSLGKIRNRIATAFYITKYITKDIDSSDVAVGNRSVLHSVGLNRPVLHCDIYGYCHTLDRYLDHDYEFCRTGMTHVKDGLDWTFALEYADYGLLEPWSFSEQADIESEVDRYVSYTQAAIDGFTEVAYDA